MKKIILLVLLVIGSSALIAQDSYKIKSIAIGNYNLSTKKWEHVDPVYPDNMQVTIAGNMITINDKVYSNYRLNGEGEQENNSEYAQLTYAKATDEKNRKVYLTLRIYHSGDNTAMLNIMYNKEDGGYRMFSYTFITN